MTDRIDIVMAGPAERLAIGAGQRAEAAAAQASTDAATALSAANAAVAAHNAFPTKAAGEAATGNGGLFSYRDSASGHVVLAQRGASGSAALPVYFGADKIAVDGWSSVAAAVARMAKLDVNGHLAIGTDTVTNGLAEIKTTAVGQPATRGLVISHYADGVGSYGLDIRAYAGASTPLVLHGYSGFLEDGPTCGVVMQIDHTKSGAHLILKNDENPVTSPGTKGSASYLTMTGYGGADGTTRNTVFLEWTHQNTVLLPDVYHPLTFLGAGVAINGTTATRGPTLDISAAKLSQPALNISGKDVGLQVVTDTNGGNTINIVKSGSLDGNVIRIVNGGIGHMLLLANGVGAQRAAIASDGSYHVGADKVVGARGAAVPNPTGGTTVDAECRASLITLLDRFRPTNGWGAIAA